MRRALVLAVLAALLALASCGGASPSPPPSSSTSAADLPPGWVQNEAIWQSLAAGEPHPRACQWLQTRPARAARLASSATSYLSIFRRVGQAYVVVLQGRFSLQGGQSASARSLYLVLMANHSYLAHGLATARIDLAPLGRVHTYVPQLPIQAGVWGHTMFAGGPFPGGPVPIARVEVAVWKGSRVPASGRPLTRTRSDGDGFFSLDLPPGVYTLRLDVSNRGWPMPDTVRVEAGKPVAAGVYGEAP